MVSNQFWRILLLFICSTMVLKFKKEYLAKMKVHESKNVLSESISTHCDADNSINVFCFDLLISMWSFAKESCRNSVTLL